MMHDHTISCKEILSEGPGLLADSKTPEHAVGFVRQLIEKAESSSTPFVSVSEKQLIWWGRLSPMAKRAAA